MENKWINKFPVLATFICMAKLWVCLPLRLSHPFWEKCTADFLVRAWQVSLSLIAKSSERHESVENGNEVCCDLHNTRHHTEPTCFPRVASFPTPETLAHYLHWQYRIQTSLWGAKRPETTVTGLTRHEDYIKQTLFILLSSTDTINIESRYLFCFAAGFCLAFFLCVCVSCTRGHVQNVPVSSIFYSWGEQDRQLGCMKKQMGGNYGSAVDAKYRIQVNTLQDSMQ